MTIPQPCAGWFAAVLAFGLCVTLTSDARATITQALSLQELVAQADHVLVVTCTDRRARREGNRRIVTDQELLVQDVLRGPAVSGSLITMLSLGGAIGDLGMRVEGEPQLQVGGRYLVFLRALSDGVTLRPVGMSQGVMAVEDGPSGPMVQPGGSGLALRHRVRGGQLLPAPPALMHPEPLEAVRERVGAVAP